MTEVLLVFSLALSAFILGVALFCLVTFGWLARFAPVRTLAESIREWVREVAVVLLTHPLLPLYYLFGRGASSPGQGTPVILVHGYFQNRVDFLYLRRALRRSGLRSVFAINYPWWDSIEENSLRLGRFVESAMREAGATSVALVGHSMGGLVALDYVVNREGALHVACCVTLGTPHEGVLFRGPLFGKAGRDLRAKSRYLTERTQATVPVPCLSIASEHDNIVFPAARASLSRRGGADALVKDRAHLGILFDSNVAELVVGFLKAHPGGLSAPNPKTALPEPSNEQGPAPQGESPHMAPR